MNGEICVGCVHDISTHAVGIGCTIKPCACLVGAQKPARCTSIYQGSGFFNRCLLIEGHRGLHLDGKGVNWGDATAERTAPIPDERDGEADLATQLNRWEADGGTPDPRQVGGDHYLRAIQIWDIVQVWELDFFRGGVLKYLLRAGHKGSAVEDLEKAQHYLERAIKVAKEKEGQ